MQEDSGFIVTYTGKRFSLVTPRPEDVDIRDIAHSLAMQCRWAGHCHRFYSVAEHSIFVSHRVADDMALMALLHDAAEAYLLDIPRPIKKMAGFAEVYTRVEQLLEEAIAIRFGIEAPFLRDAVKRADDDAMLIEASHLMRGKEAGVREWWDHDLWRQAGALTGWDPVRAESEFLYRYNWLTREKV